jgi:hypothetical protein
MTSTQEAAAVVDGLDGGVTIGRVHLTREQVDVIRGWTRSGIIAFAGQAIFKRHCGVRMLVVLEFAVEKIRAFKETKTLRAEHLACSVCGKFKKGPTD